MLAPLTINTAITSELGNRKYVSKEFILEVALTEKADKRKFQEARHSKRSRIINATAKPHSLNLPLSLVSLPLFRLLCAFIP